MTIFDQDRHISICKMEWDPVKAEKFIIDIFETTDAEFSSKYFLASPS